MLTVTGAPVMGRPWGVNVDVAASGDLGVTWGFYTVERQDPVAEEGKAYGKYVTVWRKQADGRWKATLDIGNPGPPPGE